MAENKTKQTKLSVKRFIDAADEKYRGSCRTLCKLMQEVTGEKPAMWGTALVGFGSYHYKYASGREGDFFLTGFSPRKQALTVYIMTGFDKYPALMKKLGKYKTGKSCLYIKKLEDIDMPTLTKLVERSAAHMAKGGGCA